MGFKQLNETGWAKTYLIWDEATKEATLIDPVYDPEDYLPYANEIEQAYQGNGSVALATVTKSDLTNNSKIGNKSVK